MQRLVSGAANKYSRGGGERIKPKEGLNRYRILVPDADAQFWVDLGVHWIKDQKEGGKVLAVVGCESIVYDRPCAIDTAIDEALKTANDEVSKELYESWKARKTVLVNVLERTKGSTKPDEAQILELTPATFGDIMGLIQQFAEEGEDILDNNAGVDITIKREGKGLQTKYQVNTAAGKSEPVTKAHLASCQDLMKHIEKEFFRGDEKKALNAIAHIAEVDTSAISIAARKTPTAALTSSASSVKEEEVDLSADLPEEEDNSAAEAAAAEAAKAKAVAAAKAKAAAAKAAAEAAEAEAAAAAAATETVAVDDADMDDILADLDNL